MSTYFYLISAIIGEVIATTALKASESFSKIGPSIIVVLGYGFAFYCLSLTLKVIPVGIAYAIWSGLGIVLISLLSFFLYKQRVDLPGIIGIALIIVGVAIINLFSKATAH